MGLDFTGLALKEWAPTCGALANGMQTVLLRKGGIKEPEFKPQAREFLLFPTAFHTDAQLIRPDVLPAFSQEMTYDPRQARQLLLGVYAQVTGAWTSMDAEGLLAATSPLHVWTPEFLSARLKWRPRQPVTLLELRCWRLDPVLELEPQEDYFGCFSWVNVSSALPFDVVRTALRSATPALSDERLRQCQAQLRSGLESLEVAELAL